MNPINSQSSVNSNGILVDGTPSPEKWRQPSPVKRQPSPSEIAIQNLSALADSIDSTDAPIDPSRVRQINEKNFTSAIGPSEALADDKVRLFRDGVETLNNLTRKIPNDKADLIKAIKDYVYEGGRLDEASILDDPSVSSIKNLLNTNKAQKCISVLREINLVFESSLGLATSQINSLRESFKSNYDASTLPTFNSKTGVVSATSEQLNLAFEMIKKHFPDLLQLSHTEEQEQAITMLIRTVLCGSKCLDTLPSNLFCFEATDLAETSAKQMSEEILDGLTPLEHFRNLSTKKNDPAETFKEVVSSFGKDVIYRAGFEFLNDGELKARSQGNNLEADLKFIESIRESYQDYLTEYPGEISALIENHKNSNLLKTAQQSFCKNDDPFSKETLLEILRASFSRIAQPAKGVPEINVERVAEQMKTAAEEMAKLSKQPLHLQFQASEKRKELVKITKTARKILKQLNNSTLQEYKTLTIHSDILSIIEKLEIDPQALQNLAEASSCEAEDISNLMFAKFLEVTMLMNQAIPAGPIPKFIYPLDLAVRKLYPKTNCLLIPDAIKNSFNYNAAMSSVAQSTNYHLSLQQELHEFGIKPQLLENLPIASFDAIQTIPDVYAQNSHNVTATLFGNLRFHYRTTPEMMTLMKETMNTAHGISSEATTPIQNSPSERKRDILYGAAVGVASYAASWLWPTSSSSSSSSDCS